MYKYVHNNKFQMKYGQNAYHSVDRKKSPVPGWGGLRKKSNVKMTKKMSKIASYV